ncbi:MAG TPA: hypothetical protein VF755_11135 [Catenuloplanes sp.]
MLSFDTTHALTSCLLTAEASAPTSRWDNPPTLLLIQDRPIDVVRSAQRETRTVQIPLFGDGQRGLPAMLHELANALTGSATTVAVDHDIDLKLLGGLLNDPGLRLLAWAVRYDDLLAQPDALDRVRRIDAVDVDGRVYHLTRLHQEAHPVVLIDEQPDPDHLPATQPALAALIAATTITASQKASA